MNTALAILTLLAIVAVVTALVEKNHRRLGDADRSPFGTDLEGDRDTVRTWADVSALYAHDAAPACPQARRAA